MKETLVTWLIISYLLLLDNSSIYGQPLTTLLGGGHSNVSAVSSNDSTNGTDFMEMYVTSLDMYIPDCEFNGCTTDMDCIIFGDCCYNTILKATQYSSSLPYIHKSIEDIRSRHEFGHQFYHCLEDEHDSGHFYMIDECRNPLDGVVERCGREQAFSYRDMPVDYVVEGYYITTFRNVKCAICNGVSIDNLESWNVMVVCNASVTSLTIHSEMTLEEIDKIDECKVKPVSDYHGPRQCDENAMKYREYEACNKNDTEDEYQQISLILCPLYIYPLQVRSKDNNTSTIEYGNIHCYICEHGMDVIDSFECVTQIEVPKKPEGLVPEDYISVDLQVVFNIGQSGSVVTKVQCSDNRYCEVNQIFDCISKTCKTVYCPSGKILSNGTCVDDPNYLLCQTFDVPGDSSSLAGDRNIILVVVELLHDVQLNISNKVGLNASMETLIAETLSELISDGYIVKANISDYFALVEYKWANETFDLVDRLFKVVNEITKNYSVNFANTYSITLQNYLEEKHLYCLSEQKLYKSTEPDLVLSKHNGSIDFISTLTNVSVPAYLTKWRLVYEYQNENLLYKLQSVYTCLIDDFPALDCSMVVYSINDVTLTNKTAQIIGSEIILADKEFVVHNNMVYVCSNIVTSLDTMLDIFEYRKTYRTLSLVTSSLSIGGALVVIGVHLIKKHLRNLHGLNLTALSFSILIIHILLIVQVPSMSGMACYIFAVALHTILLVMFTWTNIIGIDMTRIFMADHIAAGNNPTKRFVTYCAISVTVPVVLVVTCASLDTTTISFRPEYARDGICWLSNGTGVGVFVVAPVVVSLLLNMVCFTITVVSIKRKTNQTKFARKSSNNIYVIAFLKMIIILGFTWIFGIVGAIWEQTWLSILNIILNGLQGISLLICSLVNARNVRQFREKIKTSTTNGTKVQSVSNTVKISK